MRIHHFLLGLRFWWNRLVPTAGLLIKYITMVMVTVMAADDTLKRMQGELEL